MPYTLLVDKILLTQKLNGEDWWTIVLVHHIHIHCLGALGLVTLFSTTDLCSCLSAAAVSGVSSQVHVSLPIVFDFLVIVFESEGYTHWSVLVGEGICFVGYVSIKAYSTVCNWWNDYMIIILGHKMGKSTPFTIPIRHVN